MIRYRKFSDLSHVAHTLRLGPVVIAISCQRWYIAVGTDRHLLILFFWPPGIHVE
jgi:hypothetical protein